MLDAVPTGHHILDTIILQHVTYARILYNTKSKVHEHTYYCNYMYIYIYTLQIVLLAMTYALVTTHYQLQTACFAYCAYWERTDTGCNTPDIG